jgi:heme exporter protein A
MGNDALAPSHVQSGPAAVEASGLVVRYGRRVAVGGVDLTLAPGRALTLFGPNGAGKTTLLRVLAGLKAPTAGTVRIAGEPVTARATRALTGLVSHRVMLYPALTALENVAFSARLHGVADPEGAARAALERLAIADRAGTPVRALSCSAWRSRAPSCTGRASCWPTSRTRDSMPPAPPPSRASSRRSSPGALPSCS